MEVSSAGLFGLGSDGRARLCFSRSGFGFGYVATQGVRPNEHPHGRQRVMGDIYLITCLLLAYAVGLVAGRRQRALLPWLMAGVSVRVAMLILEVLGLWTPPQSGMDAARFIRQAEALSVQSWATLAASLDYRSATSYVVSGAALFKIIGYHPYAMQATNVVAGTVNICLAVLLVRRYVNPTAATGAAVLLCLYPFAAFNSVVALREEFAILFFLCGLALLMRWVARGNIAPFLMANVLFVFASFVHPGFIAAVIAATGFFMFSAIKDLRGGADRKNAVVSAMVGLVMFLGSVGVLGAGVELGKGIELTLDPAELSETMESRFQRESQGGSAYPALIAQGDPFTQPWLVPARVAYLLYSPFIWDVRSAIHISGLIVGLLYIWLSIRAWKAWRKGLIAGRMKVLGWMFFCLTFVFAMGVTNSGTAIRHKTKFFPLLVMLAAPTFRRRIVIGSTSKAGSVQTGSSRLGVDR